MLLQTFGTLSAAHVWEVYPPMVQRGKRISQGTAVREDDDVDTNQDLNPFLSQIVFAWVQYNIGAYHGNLIAVLPAFGGIARLMFGAIKAASVDEEGCRIRKRRGSQHRQGQQRILRRSPRPTWVRWPDTKYLKSYPHKISNCL